MRTHHSHVSIGTHDSSAELMRILGMVEGLVEVDGRSELESSLCRLLATAGDTPAPGRTLDLIGHSTADHSLLALGDFVVDASKPSVRAFFRGLAENEVLARLGIDSVRLLGCHTAASERGQVTICKLAEILEVEVFGTNQMITAGHYDTVGFKDECAHALTSSTSLRGSNPEVGRAVYRRFFDIEMLPASPLADWRHAWPRLIVDARTASTIVRLIQRADGAEMPGLTRSPTCELALPATDRSALFHVVQVLLDGDFVRVYPDGTHQPGIVFPISDPTALRALLEL